MDEKIKILDCIEPTAIEAFRKGLDPLSRLYVTISDYEPQTFAEVLAMAHREVKLDEDLARIVALKAQNKSNGKAEKNDNKKGKGRFEPYKKHDPRPQSNSS